MKQNLKEVLVNAALARMQEIDAEIEHRRQTGHITEKWCMFNHASLAHQANELEEAIYALREL